MGAIWKFFSDEDEDATPAQPEPPPAMQRTTVWGFMTGQHAEPDRSAAGMQEAIAWHEAAHARIARSQGGWAVGGMWADGESESGLTQVDCESGGSVHAFLLTCAAGQAGAMRYYRNQGYSLRKAKELAAEGTGSDRAQFEAAAAAGGQRWDDYVDEAYRIVRRQEYTIEQNAKPLARRGHRGGTWA